MSILGPVFADPQYGVRAARRGLAFLNQHMFGWCVSVWSRCARVCSLRGDCYQWMQSPRKLRTRLRFSSVAIVRHEMPGTPHVQNISPQLSRRRTPRGLKRGGLRKTTAVRPESWCSHGLSCGVRKDPFRHRQTELVFAFVGHTNIKT